MMPSLTSDKVREIRTQYRVTQSEWARITGFSVVSINRWENGKVHGTGPERMYRLLDNPAVFKVAKALADEKLAGTAGDDVQPARPSTLTDAGDHTSMAHG